MKKFVAVVFFVRTRVAPVAALALGHLCAGLSLALLGAGRFCRDASRRLLPAGPDNAVRKVDQSYRYDYADQDAEVFVCVTLPGRAFNRYLAEAVRTKAGDILDIAQRISAEVPVTRQFHAEVGVKDGKPVLTV